MEKERKGLTTSHVAPIPNCSNSQSSSLEVLYMNGTIHVGNLFGIPFYVAPSWFLVLGLVTWSYTSGLATQFPAWGSLLPLLGLTTALLLFASVLAHELGHSFVAIRQGIEVKSITLFLFGGLASLEKESKTPSEAFWVALAGPLVSLLLFGLLTAINASVPLLAPFAAVVGTLAYVNLALALFNLIPGLPLDGGNILKALIWKITGNPEKGVVFASSAGQFIGWLAIASGLIPLLLFGTFGNFWNLILGWFLLQNATRTAQSATLQSTLKKIKVADVVNFDSPIVSADLSLREFADESILGHGKWERFLVTDLEGQLVGTMTLDALRVVPTSRWTQTQVRELMQPLEASAMIQSEQSLLEAVKILEQQQRSALPVIGENGVLVGLLEKAAVLSWLQKRVQAPAY
jgi:Zn-dependent protease/CBS domain-containing protein